MSDTNETPVLPDAPRLPLKRQVHLLIMLGIGIALVFALVIGVRALLAPPEEKEAPPAPPGVFRPTPQQLQDMKFVQVSMGDASQTLSAMGTISADEDHSTPVLMPYSGQVTQVLVEAGERVRQGQPLLRANATEFVDTSNALLAAAAQRASAYSQLRLAENNLKRQEEIYKSAGGAQKDYLQAQNDLVAAQSAARSADAAIAAQRDRLAIMGKSPAEIAELERPNGGGAIRPGTVLRSPVDGVVISRSVSPGQYVSTGSDKTVMVISDLSHVWLVAQLPEGAADLVRVGDGIEVETPALPGRTFHATINNVAAALDPVTHRLPVRATIANPDGALKPQMFASFRISSRIAGKAMWVPGDAVIREGDSARVWVLARNNSLVSRNVQVSDSRNGMVRVESGLQPGEKIVTSGAIFVNEAGMGA